MCTGTYNKSSITPRVPRKVPTMLVPATDNLPPSTALTTRWLNFFYTHFTLRSVETYPYFWTSGINLVSQSSQLYKIRELPAKIKLLIIWVEIVFCQQQKKTTLYNWLWPDFVFKLFIVGPILLQITYFVAFDWTQTLISSLNGGWERRKVLKRWIWFVLARILNNAVQSQSKHNSLSLHSTYWTPLRPS